MSICIASANVAVASNITFLSDVGYMAIALHKHLHKKFLTATVGGDIDEKDDFCS